MFRPLFLLSGALFFTFSKATESNSGIFTVKERYRNNLGVFHKSKEHKTILSCGHACLRDNRCIGTNFRSGSDGDSDCELVDISPSDLSRGLEFDHDWVFSVNTKVNMPVDFMFL